MAPLVLRECSSARTLSLFVSFCAFKFVELCAQYRKRMLAIRLLAPLGACVRRNAGGLMRNAHRRLAFVDILSSRTTRACKRNFQIIVFNRRVGWIMNFGQNLHQRKRGVAALVCIKRGNAHKPMNAKFFSQIPVAKTSLNANRRIAYAAEFRRVRMEPLAI